MLQAVLVDDEKPALKSLERLLKRYPEIEIAGMFTDAEQAVALVKGGNIDVLFLDINMPGINGIMAAREIFSYDENIAIVFVTAHAQFAVEAFELNVLDYIMKPVSAQRMNMTIKRIMQSYLKSDAFGVQESKNEFLNALTAEKITNPEEILKKAKMLHINFKQSFSFFFLLLYDADNPNIHETLDSKDRRLHALIEELSADDSLLVWQTSQGIAILNYAVTASADCKSEEKAAAAKLKEVAARCFPEKVAAVGIANRYTKLEKFADRYVEARNAVMIGIRVSPHLGIYHIVDSFFLPLLYQYVNTECADNLIDKTIGKLIEHDRVTGTDLFHTMEMIILNHSFQTVANILFIHYKTVLFRKQAIEKILGISINSFVGRTMLSLALMLFYLKDIPDIRNQ